jgi:RimJ/RimL family protein N-acetyltransferase
MITNNYILRLITKEDNKDIYNILKLNEVSKYLNINKINSIKDVDNLIDEYLQSYNKGTKQPLAILDKKTNDFIGVLILKLDLYNEDSYEFTVYIHPKYQNKGVVTEVTNNIVLYFFKNYKQNTLRGYIMEGNIASQKMIKKCNFTYESKFKVPYLEDFIVSYIIQRKDINIK